MTSSPGVPATEPAPDLRLRVALIDAKLACVSITAGDGHPSLVVRSNGDAADAALAAIAEAGYQLVPAAASATTADAPTSEQIAELQLLLALIEPAPWYVETSHDGRDLHHIPHVLAEQRGLNALECGEDGNVAKFVAAARNLLPGVLAALAARDAELRQLREQLATANADAEKWDVLTAQTCPRSVHRDWWHDGPELLPCPWCASDALREQLDEIRQSAIEAGERE